MPSCTCHDVQSLTRFVPAKGMGVPDESFGYLYDDIGNQNVGTVTDSYAYGPFGQCAAAGTTSNPFRFSSEYLDTATRFVCYYYCECGRDSKRLFLSGP